MKSLIIDFSLQDPEIRLKGLNLRKIKGSNIWQSIYREQDDGKFYIDARSKIDNKTAKIKKSELIPILKELKQIIPFDKVKIVKNYELSGEQIFSML